MLSLQRAGGQNDANRIWMRVDPVYDELRSDKRFQELVRFQGTSWQ